MVFIFAEQQGGDKDKLLASQTRKYVTSLGLKIKMDVLKWCYLYTNRPKFIDNGLHISAISMLNWNFRPDDPEEAGTEKRPGLVGGPRWQKQEVLIVADVSLSLLPNSDLKEAHKLSQSHLTVYSVYRLARPSAKCIGEELVRGLLPKRS